MFVKMPGYLGLVALDEGDNAPLVSTRAMLPPADPIPTIPQAPAPELSLTTTAPAPAPEGGTWVTVQNNDYNTTTSDVFVPYGTPIYGWVDTTPNAEHSDIRWQMINENAGPPPLPPGVGPDWTMVQEPAPQYQWGNAPAPAPVYVAPWSPVVDVAPIAPNVAPPAPVYIAPQTSNEVLRDLSPPPAVSPVPQVVAPAPETINAPAPAPAPAPVINAGGGGNVSQPVQFLPGQTVPRQTALPAGTVDDTATADGRPLLPGQTTQAASAGGFGVLLAIAGFLLSQ